MTLFRLERWYCGFVRPSLPKRRKAPAPNALDNVAPRSDRTHRSGLGLGDEVPPEHDGFDRALLDRRRLLETVRVDPPEQLLGDLHGVERLDGLVPVGLEVGVGQVSWRLAFGRRRGTGISAFYIVQAYYGFLTRL